MSLGVLAQTTAIGRTRVAAQPNTGGTGCKTGRINRWSEAALKSAVEMLATTKDQKFKANLIRTILDYEVRQQERAETNKAARRKRAENTELAELRSKVAELTAQPASANNSRTEEISDLRACLKETDGISPRAFAFLGGVQVVVGSLTDRFSVRILGKEPRQAEHSRSGKPTWGFRSGENTGP